MSMRVHAGMDAFIHGPTSQNPSAQPNGLGTTTIKIPAPQRGAIRPAGDEILPDCHSSNATLDNCFF